MKPFGLVGGFKHFSFSISYMGCHPSHWRTHIFQRGRYTTNQFVRPIKIIKAIICGYIPLKKDGSYLQFRSNVRSNQRVRPMDLTLMKPWISHAGVCCQASLWWSLGSTGTLGSWAVRRFSEIDGWRVGKWGWNQLDMGFLCEKMVGSRDNW